MNRRGLGVLLCVVVLGLAVWPGGRGGRHVFVLDVRDGDGVEPGDAVVVVDVEATR